MKSDVCNLCVQVLAAVVLAFCSTSAGAAEPEMPKPTAQHELLKQFVGEWTTKATTVVAPGEQPMTCEGTESARMIGRFWLISQGEGTMLNLPVSSLMTIGYDPATKKYVGTFVCSMDSTHWKYVGTMEPDGKKLVLETEGPLPQDPSKKAKFRETLELVDSDHKVFMSYLIGDDGKLTEFAKVEYQRKN